MNRPIRSVRPLAVALAMLVFASAASVGAQELPAGTDVLARYRAALGGEQALASHQSVHTRGEFSMPAAGLTAALEGFSAKPNRSAIRITIPGLGEVRTGYTGAVAWAMDPMQGPRLLEGDEARQLADAAVFESSLRPTSLLESATTVERTTIGGRECLKVQLVWKSGRETHDCFSEETGLLVATQEKLDTRMGPIDSVVLFDDYRAFGGVMMATRTTTQRMGVDQIITLSDVQFDSVPDSAMEPPAEIRALIGG
jgi:hypothetical protein